MIALQNNKKETNTSVAPRYRYRGKLNNSYPNDSNKEQYETGQRYYYVDSSNVPSSGYGSTIALKTTDKETYDYYQNNFAQFLIFFDNKDD